MRLIVPSIAEGNGSLFGSSASLLNQLNFVVFFFSLFVLLLFLPAAMVVVRNPRKSINDNSCSRNTAAKRGWLPGESNESRQQHIVLIPDNACIDKRSVTIVKIIEKYSESDGCETR